MTSRKEPRRFGSARRARGANPRRPAYTLCKGRGGRACARRSLADAVDRLSMQCFAVGMRGLLGASAVYSTQPARCCCCCCCCKLSKAVQPVLDRPLADPFPREQPPSLVRSPSRVRFLERSPQSCSAGRAPILHILDRAIHPVSEYRQLPLILQRNNTLPLERDGDVRVQHRCVSVSLPFRNGKAKQRRKLTLTCQSHHRRRPCWVSSPRPRHTRHR